MAKEDFFKTWKVSDPGHVSDVFTDTSSFVIFDDGGDKVLIQYTGFGSGYPAIQDGLYLRDEDKIFANFSAHIKIVFDFDHINSIPDFNRLRARVGDFTNREELGEWDAEADSGT